MINKIMTGLMGIVAAGMLTLATVQSVPWYRYIQEPTIINTETYYSPGDELDVKFTRISLINTQARSVRELVRVDMDGNEWEVSRVTTWLDIDRGARVITTNWHIPHVEECPNMKPNTYLWRGSITYKPFGMLEKTVKFTTNTFHIRY